MGVLNIAELGKVADQIVSDAQIDKTEQETTFTDRLEKAEPISVNSLGMKMPVITGYNESESWAGSDGQAVATPGATKFDNIFVRYKFVNASGLITKEAMDNASDPTANWSISQEIASTVKTAKKALNRAITNGDGLGTIAIVSANYAGGSPNNIVCAPSANWTHGSRFVGTGKYINVVNSAGTVVRAAGVTDPDAILESADNNIATSTITLTTAAPTDMVAGDRITAERSVNKYVQGLPAQIANTGDFFGLTRSSFPGLQSVVQDAGGAALTLSMVDKNNAKMKYKAGLAAAKGGEGGAKVELWTAPTMVEAYRAASYSLAMVMAGGKLDAGYSNQVLINGYEFNEDTDLPANVMYFLKMNTLKKVVRGNAEKPFEIIDFGTGKFTPERDTRGRRRYAFLFNVGGYFNLYCTNPRANGVIKNIGYAGFEAGNF